MFDFTDPSHNGRPSGAVLPVGRQQRLRLDRVTQRGPGPVRLHRVHLRRRQARPPPAPPGSPAAATGRSAPSARCDAPSWFTALPRTTASTRCPLRTRVRQPLQHQHPRALGPARCRRPPPRTTCTARPRPARRCRLNSDERARRGHHRDARRPAPACTPPPAAPAPPGAAPPATTSTPCPPSPPGPPSPSAYDTRPEITLPALPGQQVALAAARPVRATSSAVVLAGSAPANTPVGLPAQRRRVDPGPLQRLPRRPPAAAAAAGPSPAPPAG